MNIKNVHLDIGLSNKMFIVYIQSDVAIGKTRQSQVTSNKLFKPQVQCGSQRKFRSKNQLLLKFLSSNEGSLNWGLSSVLLFCLVHIEYSNFCYSQMTKENSLTSNTISN